MRVTITQTRSPYYWYKKHDIGKTFDVDEHRKKKTDGTYCYVTKDGPTRFIDCRDCVIVKREKR